MFIALLNDGSSRRIFDVDSSSKPQSIRPNIPSRKLLRSEDGCACAAATCFVSKISCLILSENASESCSNPELASCSADLASWFVGYCSSKSQKLRFRKFETTFATILEFVATYFLRPMTLPLSDNVACIY